MLKSIKISNFKSIQKEVELSFEIGMEEVDEYYLTNDNLLKLALIYGPNASGKTTIIKAIEFIVKIIFNPAKNKEELINITPFKFTENIKKNSKFILEFIENNNIFVYEIELNNKEVTKEILKYKDLNLKRPTFALVFERNKNIIKWGSKIKITTSQKNTLNLNTLPNMLLLSGYLRTNININVLDNVINFFKRILPPIYPYTDLLGFALNKIEENEVNKKEIINILKSADFAIEDFNIEENEIEEDFANFLKKIGKEIDNFKKIEIWFNHFKKYKLEFEEESRGTQRFYQLAVILTLLTKNSYIIAIDEIESSLHPDLLKFFILTFLNHSTNSQIILTTHTRELLLEKDILRKDVIWFCEKMENGSTDLFSLIDFGNEIKDISIYNYYKYGKIGAIPNLKSLGIFSEKKK